MIGHQFEQLDATLATKNRTGNTQVVLGEPDIEAELNSSLLQPMRHPVSGGRIETRNSGGKHGRQGITQSIQQNGLVVSQLLNYLFSQSSPIPFDHHVLNVTYCLRAGTLAQAPAHVALASPNRFARRQTYKRISLLSKMTIKLLLD
jgi:hypothetical protein